MIIHQALSGLQVMVVEDEMLIAIMIEDLLTEQNCRVVGPFNAVPAALAAARAAHIDLAVLDVNVRGEKIYPVAEVLAMRRIPFILLSGYGDDAVPRDRPGWTAHAKPFKAAKLTELLASRVSAGS